jgi:hypothetical protein
MLVHADSLAKARCMAELSAQSNLVHQQKVAIKAFGSRWLLPRDKQFGKERQRTSLNTPYLN